MTAAAQKQIFKQVLAMPRKARASLWHQLDKSLAEDKEEKISKKEWSRLWKAELERRMEEMESGKDKGIPAAKVMAELRAKYGSLEASKGTTAKALPGAQVMADSTVVYGQKKATVRAKDTNSKSEVLSKEEWDEEWKSELEKRLADVESGKVKCIPYSEVRKKWTAFWVELERAFPSSSRA